MKQEKDTKDVIDQEEEHKECKEYKDYKKKRLQNQIDWFGERSAKNRRMYERLRAVQITIGALIPFLSGLLFAVDGYQTTIGIVTVSYGTIGTVLVGTLGVLAAVATGMLNLKRYRENWVEYRKMGETLQREKYLFETEAAPYNKKNRFTLLVQNVEGLLANENLNWSQYVTKSEKAEEAKQT